MMSVLMPVRNLSPRLGLPVLLAITLAALWATLLHAQGAQFITYSNPTNRGALDSSARKITGLIWDGSTPHVILQISGSLSRLVELNSPTDPSLESTDLSIYPAISTRAPLGGAVWNGSRVVLMERTRAVQSVKINGTDGQSEGSLPTEAATPIRTLAHDGSQYIAVDKNGFVWTWANGANASTATKATNALPSSVRDVQASTWDGTQLLLFDSSDDDFWILRNLTDPSTATKNSDLPATLTTVTGAAFTDDYLMLIDDGGDNGWTYDATYPAPPALQGLVANGGSTTTISLTWTDPGDSYITKYQYRVSSDNGATWTPNWTDVPGSGASTTTYTVTGLSPSTAYVIQLRAVRRTSPGSTSLFSGTTDSPPPTPTPWADSVQPNTVRLVSVISYTLDIEELNRLEIERARADFPLRRAAVFSCVSSDGMSVMVSDSAVSDDTTGIHAWKLPKEQETALQALVLGIRSDKIRDMSCQARIWDKESAEGEPALETNAVKLSWQRKGRTIFRKEEAFRGTPGGTATWLFIPPVFLGLVFAGATKNAAGTLLVVAVSLGIAVWFTESPPVLWFVVVATAAAGVLLFIQFGFRGR